MDRFLDRASSIILILGTLVVVGVVLFRDDSGTVTGVAGEEAPEFQDNWDSLLSAGHRLSGSNDARIRVVEFIDLQCPACKAYQPGLERALEADSDDVQLVYAPYPLEMHEHAVAAANATDCLISNEPEQLGNWVHLVLSKQDSLGIKSWGSFAREAGVRDTAAIAICMQQQRGVAKRVESSLAYGRSPGITATPSIMINGWMYSGLPGPDAVKDAIHKLLEDPGSQL